MLVKLSVIPGSFQSIPTSAHVTAIYATAPGPFGVSDRVRVRVLGVHRLAGRSLVATVQIRPGFETWQVYAASLTAVSFQVSMEVNS
jgi:hypothetical protein